MKRRPPTKVIVLLLALLAGGAIANVAVAWGLALNPPKVSGLAAFRTPNFAGSPAEGLENTVWLINQRRSFGVTRMLAFPRLTRYNFPFDGDVEGLYPTWSGWPEALDDLDYFNLNGEEIVEAAGLPMTALRSDWSFPPLDRLVMNEGWKNAIPLPPGSYVSGGATYPYARALPLQPVWPGFAINTVFYAAVLWLVFAAPFTLRRWIRIKRGLCPKCAYPVGASDICTECGALLATRPGGPPTPRPPSIG